MNEDYFIKGDIIDRIDAIDCGVNIFRRETDETIAFINSEISSKADYDYVASIQCDSELIRQDIDSLKNDVEYLKQVLIGIYDKLEYMELPRTTVDNDALIGLLTSQ